MALEVPNRTFITPVDLRKRYGHFDPNIWSRWQKQEKVKKLRNGLYFNEDYTIRGQLDFFAMANQIYSPSYISLISAFRYYNLIPEIVYKFTSVSTRKTKRFNTEDAVYSYRSIQSEYFFGYQTEYWRGNYFNLAYLEKAIIDFAYLTPELSEDGYLEEMRFEEEILNEISWERMHRYLWLINSDTLNERIQLLKNVYEL